LFFFRLLKASQEKFKALQERHTNTNNTQALKSVLMSKKKKSMKLDEATSSNANNESYSRHETTRIHCHGAIYASII